MKGLVSIIIPVYNAEKYIDDCLKSVVSQTYDKLQILVINDGSTDNSRAIAEKFAEKDSRVEVISKENGGVSSARNLGIKNAKGEYICFVDADDYLDCRFAEILVSGFEEKNCVISACDILRNFQRESIKNNADGNAENRAEIYSIGDAFRSMCKNGNIYPSSCNKMFLTEVIKSNDLYCDSSLVYGEDTLFLLKYYACVYDGKMTYFPDAKLYINVMNPTSAMSKRKKGYTPNWFHQTEALDRARSYAEDKGLTRFAEEIRLRKCYVCTVILDLFVMTKYRGEEYKQLLKEFRKAVPDFLESDLFGKKIKNRVRWCAKSPVIKHYLMKFKLI